MSVYNNKYGFPQDHYSANALLFNVQYTSRDNQNRAYKGIYFDAGFRANQEWLGSTKNSIQLTSDFRKYFSLSTVNPEMVLAFWNWGSYLLSGSVQFTWNYRVPAKTGLPEVEGVMCSNILKAHNSMIPKLNFAFPY